MYWFEQSLTPKELKTPDFNVSTRYFFSEQEEKWAFGDSDKYFYEEKKLTSSMSVNDVLDHYLATSW